jgi:hypothetical protein
MIEMQPSLEAVLEMHSFVCCHDDEMMTLIISNFHIIHPFHVPY